jgi:hypothetical protein
LRDCTIKNHKREKLAIENIFKSFKKKIRGLHGKFELDVDVAPNLVTCCCILHNMLIGHNE